MRAMKYIVFSLVLLSILLSGCGGATPTTVATEAPQPAATQASQPAATEAPAASTEKQEVVYWSLWNEGEPQADVLKQYMADYTAAHPNVTFNVTWAGREVLTKLQTALSAGQKVDLVDHEGPALRGGLTVKGLTLPLDKYLKQNAYDESVPFESIFVPGTLKLLAAEDGSIQFIPYEIITTALLYDQRNFEKYKLTKPTTWDEFIALLQSVKDQGGQPLTQDAGVDFYNAMWYYTLVERFLGPGQLIKAATDKTGAMWDDPAFLKAAQMERDLWDKGFFPDGAEGFVWPAGQQMLANGEAFMEICGTWLPNELKTATDPEFKWGSFMIPNVPDGKGKQSDVEAYLLGWVIMKDAPHADAAADFIKFSMTKANAQKIPDTAVNLSARKDTTPPEALADAWNDFTNATAWFLPYDGINANYADYYKNTFLKIHDQMFLRKITPEEFVAQIKAATVEWWKTH